MFTVTVYDSTVDRILCIKSENTAGQERLHIINDAVLTDLARILSLYRDLVRRFTCFQMIIITQKDLYLPDSNMLKLKILAAL
jgi:hypothetical protein